MFLLYIFLTFKANFVKVEVKNKLQIKKEEEIMDNFLVEKESLLLVGFLKARGLNFQGEFVSGRPHTYTCYVSPYVKIQIGFKKTDHLGIWIFLLPKSELQRRAFDFLTDKFDNEMHMEFKIIDKTEFLNYEIIAKSIFNIASITNQTVLHIQETERKKNDEIYQSIMNFVDEIKSE